MTYLSLLCFSDLENHCWRSIGLICEKILSWIVPMNLSEMRKQITYAVYAKITYRSLNLIHSLSRYFADTPCNIDRSWYDSQVFTLLRFQDSQMIIENKKNSSSFKWYIFPIISFLAKFLSSLSRNDNIFARHENIGKICKWTITWMDLRVCFKIGDSPFYIFLINRFGDFWPPLGLLSNTTYLWKAPDSYFAWSCLFL